MAAVSFDSLVKAARLMNSSVEYVYKIDPEVILFLTQKRNFEAMVRGDPETAKKVLGIIAGKAHDKVSKILAKEQLL